MISVVPMKTVYKYVLVKSSREKLVKRHTIIQKLNKIAGITSHWGLKNSK